MMRRKEEKGSSIENNTLKAVIPAAGFGTRFQPFTLAVPKELLPVNRKPMIQLAVEEALAAGIRDIGIVIRKGKEVIQDYFEALIKSSDSMWGNLKHELSGTRLDFIFQKRPLGLGNAIYEAGRFINELPFIMIIPDQFVFSRVPATRQLLNAARGNFQAVWSTLVAVPEEELHFFPGARRFELTNRIGKIWEVTGIRDGSGHSKEESLLGFGRSFFPAGALDFFTDEFLNPVTGEVDLLPSFDALIKEYRNYAVLLEGKAMDFGTWEGYERFSKTINQQGIEETNHAR